MNYSRRHPRNRKRLFNRPITPCSNRPGYFERLADRYHRYVALHPDRQLAFCVAQPTFPAAVAVAARSIDHRGKIHGHQCWIGAAALDAFAPLLIPIIPQLEAAESFDEIYSLIESIAPYGIGDLTIYDTACRIAAYRDKPPTKVYLHCGARDGAEKLLGPLRRRKFIEVTEIPLPLQQLGLTPGQLEDILCIYKKEFELYPQE